MQKYFILLLVVGVFCTVAFGQGNNNNNQGGNDGNADYSGSSDPDDASVSNPSEGNSNLNNSPSASNDEDHEYFFDGDLDASAFRDDGDGVPVRASISGQVFLSKQDFKKLSKLQKRGQTNAVQVKGFAVATGMKDACAGIFEAKADLFFISSKFRMQYQGTMTFTAADLDALGGEDGMIRIMGMISLRFRSSETSVPSEKRSVGDLGDSGYIYLYYCCMK